MQTDSLTPSMDSGWLDVLRAEVDKTSAGVVGKRLGYSRTSVSLVLAGKYNGGTERVAAKVNEVFRSHVLCPHLGQEITRGDCREVHGAPMPMSDRSKFKHWMACENCSHSLRRADQ